MEINSSAHISVGILGKNVVTRVPVTEDLTVNVVHTEKELIKLLLEYRESLAILRGVKSANDIAELSHNAETENNPINNE